MRARNHDETETRSLASRSKQDNDFTPFASTATNEANCLSSIIAACKLEISNWITATQQGMTCLHRLTHWVTRLSISFPEHSQKNAGVTGCVKYEFTAGERYALSIYVRTLCDNCSKLSDKV